MRRAVGRGPAADAARFGSRIVGGLGGMDQLREVADRAAGHAGLAHRVGGDRVAEEDPAVLHALARVVHVEVEQRVDVLRRAVGHAGLHAQPVVAREVQRVLARVPRVAGHARQHHPAIGRRGAAAGSRVAFQCVAAGDVVADLADRRVVVGVGDGVVPGDQHAAALGAGHARQVVGQPAWHAAAVVGVVARVVGAARIRRAVGGGGGHAAADQRHRGRRTAAATAVGHRDAHGRAGRAVAGGIARGRRDRVRAVGDARRVPGDCIGRAGVFRAEVGTVELELHAGHADVVARIGADRHGGRHASAGGRRAQADCRRRAVA